VNLLSSNEKHPKELTESENVPRSEPQSII